MSSHKFSSLKNSKYIRQLGTYVPPTFKTRVIKHGAFEAFKQMMESSFLYNDVKFEALQIKVKFIDFVWIVFYMFDNVRRSTSVIQVMNHIMAMLGQLMKKDLSDLINYLGQHVINIFIDIFGGDIIAKAQSDFVVKNIQHAQDFIKNIRENLFTITDKFESVFAQKLALFMGGVLTLPMALHFNIGENWFGYTKAGINRMLRTKNETHTFVFTTKCIESFLYLIDRVLDCVKCKDITRLTFDDNFMLNYNKHYKWHVHHMNQLELICNFKYVDPVTNEESEHVYTYEGYLRNIVALLEMNKSASDTNCDKKIKAQLKVEKAVLEKAYNNIQLKLQVNGGREAPFALAIVGSPGIGKTAVGKIVLKVKNDIDKGLGRNPVGFKEELIYHYNGRERFMPGLTSAHTAFIMDDLGQFKDEITTAQQGGAIAYIIDIINDNKLVTEQAELELKGKIPFRCRDVIITSNFEDCGFGQVFDKKGGAWRRVLFMDCKVKPEFCVPGETRLAGDKENPDNFDMHLYRFRRYLNNNGDNTRVFWDGSEWNEDPAASVWMDIFDMSVFLRDVILIPRYEQMDRAKHSGENFLQSASCSYCKLPKLVCRCAVAQSDDSDDFEHTADPDSSSHASSVFIGPEEWISYISRWISLVHMTWLYSVMFISCKWATDVTQASRAHNGISSFNLSYTDHDSTDTFLSRKRRWLCDYFIVKNYEITKKDYLTGMIENNRRILRLEYGVTAVVAAMSAFVAMNCVYSFFKKEEEQTEEHNDDGLANAQTRDGDDEDDYWTVKYEDMTRMTGSSSNITVGQMKNLMTRNTMMLEVDCGTSTFHVNCLGLYGNIGILPRHAYEQLRVRNFKANITLLRHNKKLRVGSSRYNVKLDETNFTVYSHCKDFVTVQCTAFGTFRDVRKFLLGRPFVGKAEGFICGRAIDGNFVEFHVKAFQTGEVHYIHRTLSKRYHYVGYKAYSHRPTFTGLCGAPYIVKTCNGIFIAGIHVAMKDRGMDYEVQCCPVRQHEMDHKYHTLVPNSYNGLDLNETYVSTQDLAITQTTHEKCPLRDLASGSSLMFYGSLGTHRPKLKSHVANTIFYEPVLKYFDMLDVEYFSPKDISARKCITLTVNKMCKKSSFQPADIMAMKKSLVSRYIRVIDKQNIKVEPHLAPLSAAINGVDGEPYWNRLPVKTSGGFAHKGAKLKYFEEGASAPDHELNYHLIDDVMKEIDEAHRRVKNGERITSIWDITFKDEPVTAEKIRKNKCRLFNSASLFFSILERQAFMWTFPLFSGKHRHLFGCAIGANATGRDWTVLYNHIVKFGSDRIIAGDYSSFDKGMESALVAAAFDVLLSIAKHVGFSSEDINFMSAVATEVIYPITNVSGTVVEFYGTNPSGHSLTTIINSVVNCLYMMLSCNVIAREDGLNVNFDYFFEDCMSLLTYGDDNIASSNVDAFNHTRISFVLGLSGVIYTMPDKQSKSKKFSNLFEVSFLRRNFVRREDKFIRAPLAEESIIKMLTVCTVSRSISKEDQCAQIVDSACREYFQYGQKTFEKRRKFLTKLLTDYNLWGYLTYTELPTYDEIKLMCYGDIADAQSEEISYEEPVPNRGPMPGVFDPRFVKPGLIPYGQSFIFMGNAFVGVLMTVYFSYLFKHRSDYFDFYNQIAWYMWFFHFYVLLQFTGQMIHLRKTGNIFGAIPEAIAPDEYFTDREGYMIRLKHTRKIHGYAEPYVSPARDLAEAQSEMFPNNLVRAQSAPELHDDDSDSDESEFYISDAAFRIYQEALNQGEDDDDDSYMDYVRWDEDSASPLVDKYDEPEERDGAQIYDSCVLFTNCFCIARYGELYRELSCTRCHCEFGRNCVSTECNKENISVTLA